MSGLGAPYASLGELVEQGCLTRRCNRSTPNLGLLAGGNQGRWKTN